MVAHVHGHGSELHRFVEAEARRAESPRAEREPRPLGEAHEQLEPSRRHLRCPLVERLDAERGIRPVRVPDLLPNRVGQAAHEGAEHVLRLDLDRVPDAAAHERDGDLPRSLVESARGKHERVRWQDLLRRLVVLADGEVPTGWAQRQERWLDGPALTAQVGSGPEHRDVLPRECPASRVGEEVLLQRRTRVIRRVRRPGHARPALVRDPVASALPSAPTPEKELQSPAGSRAPQQTYRGARCDAHLSSLTNSHPKSHLTRGGSPGTIPEASFVDPEPARR